MIDRIALDYDESGYTLLVSGDHDLPIALADLVFSVPEEVLYEFLDSRQVQAALEHRAEGEAVRRERAAHVDPREAYEIADPKHPDHHDVMSGHADD
jgi:hypothetical protein